MNKEVYKFKKGQKIHLDEKDYSPDRGPGSSRRGLTDNLIVTKNIKFTIIIEEKP